MYRTLKFVVLFVVYTQSRVTVMNHHHLPNLTGVNVLTAVKCPQIDRENVEAI